MKSGVDNMWSKCSNWQRPLMLFIIVALIVAAVIFFDRANNYNMLKSLLHPVESQFVDPRFWSAWIYALTFVMGLPVAFLLWFWRDRNVRDQIDNARKETNLKEFQEVQLRAAGALDEKLPQEAREQLQIAALHQLRGFLRGEYGESFMRPAFELLLAGHAAAVYRVGVPEVRKQIEGKSFKRIRNAVLPLRENLTRIDHARMLIICDEAEFIFTSTYPLNGRRFDLLDLSKKQFPDKLDLRSSHFFDANLSQTSLKSANLAFAKLESASLDCSKLTNADLRHAGIQGTLMCETELEGADLRSVWSNGACGMNSARFNNATQFGDWFTMRDWITLTEVEREAARAPWIARGMINVDAKPADG